jgi:hypothetical protein
MRRTKQARSGPVATPRIGEANVVEQTKTVSSSSGLDDPALSPFVQAYRDYVAAVQRALARPESWQRLKEAQHTYAQAGSDSQKQSDAYRSYTSAVTDLCNPAELRDRLAEAYGNYVKAVQSAWSSADAGSLTPFHLALIASSLGAVATSAAPWSLFEKR